MYKKVIPMLLVFSFCNSVLPPAVAGKAITLEQSDDSNVTDYQLSHVVYGLGSATKKGHIEDNLSDQALSAASGFAGEHFSGWLRKLGTAQVNLNVNRNGEWENSSLDWLIPWWQSPGDLLFTQLGFRAPEGRKTVNAGVGIRISNKDWMYGANTFIDNDMSGNNRRIGFGVEAWHDNFKLSANYYQGMTGWHQSKDFVDFDERPADGWDLRTQMSLPELPQIGGQLVYEKYYGDSVALMDRDNRHKNPSAIIAGLSYTPVPLVTLGVDHQMASGDRDDTLFSLKFRYQFDIPWQEQISPEAVSESRSLAGSRYDLVERNNTVILDYRKQELITLRLTPSLRVESGDEVVIPARITSKYSVRNVEWDSSEIVRAGGKIIAQSVDGIRLSIPVWKNNDDNHYIVSAVAHDVKGNRSNLATTQIDVNKPSVLLTSGNVTVIRDNAVADGVSTNEIQAKVTDSKNKPVAGQVVMFSATNGSVLKSVSGITGANGIARTTLTNTKSGESFVTASLSNGQAGKVRVMFTEGIQIARGDLIVTRNNAPADGISINAVQARVTNMKGEPLASQSVRFNATNGATVTTITGTTGSDGIASANLTNRVAGETIVTAGLSNGISRHVKATFTSVNGIALRNITVLKNNALANGVDTDVVKFQVTDGSGRPLAGQVVSFSADNGAKITVSSALTADDGRITVSLTNVKKGPVILTGSLVNGQSARIRLTFITPAEIKKDTFIVTNDNALADGKATNAVRLIVVNGNEVPVQGQDVYFSATNGANVVTAITKTDSNGLAATMLTSTIIGDSKVTARLADDSYASVIVHFVTPATIESGSFIVTADNAMADGKAKNAVQLKVVNSNGEGMQGQQIDFSATNGVRVIKTSTVTNSSGIATTTLTSTTPGLSTVKATLHGSNKTATTVVSFKPVYRDFAGISVYGHQFSVASGFPRTGFVGASFSLILPGNVSANDYKWETSASWVTVTGEVGVSKGTVSFSAKGAGSAVTVTAAPLSGRGDSYRYTFKLKKWFIFNSSPQDRVFNTTFCQMQGYQVPSYSDMTNASTPRQDGSRAIGYLWSEWGDLSMYPADVRATPTYMAREHDSSSQYGVRLTTGWIYNIDLSTQTQAACVHEL